MFNFLGMLIRKLARYTSLRPNKTSATAITLGTVYAASRMTIYLPGAFLHFILFPFVFIFVCLFSEFLLLLLETEVHPIFLTLGLQNTAFK